jgi:hypothetical protein
MYIPSHELDSGSHSSELSLHVSYDSTFTIAGGCPQHRNTQYQVSTLKMRVLGIQDIARNQISH